ncbi:chromosome transmission fidelity protein 8 [Mariannaea sp. PMI_226]|nr:chromosome transmission fidelity protein 8 [Mariannaea sp. PMI_226]
MSSFKLYPPSKASAAPSSPLPQLIQTPSGLALLELQGTINLPQDAEGEPLPKVEVGRIDFPDYTPDALGSAWMNRVHLYVGQYQRLNGVVKKLPKAIAVVRRREGSATDRSDGEGQTEGESLEVVEIVKYKLMFSNRPEPVGTSHAP